MKENPIRCEFRMVLSCILAQFHVSSYNISIFIKENRDFELCLLKISDPHWGPEFLYFLLRINCSESNKC